MDLLENKPKVPRKPTFEEQCMQYLHRDGTIDYSLGDACRISVWLEALKKGPMTEEGFKQALTLKYDGVEVSKLDNCSILIKIEKWFKNKCNDNVDLEQEIEILNLWTNIDNEIEETEQCVNIEDSVDWSNVNVKTEEDSQWSNMTIQMKNICDMILERATKNLVTKLNAVQAMKGEAGMLRSQGRPQPFMNVF
jgi:hypothetical protein